MDEKRGDYSSTESLQFRKNVTIADPKEVRFIKLNQNKNHRFKDDRIFVTSQKVPFFLFSSLPYYKGRNARTEARKEGQRRRNISGNRPLSSNDQPLRFDAFNLILGVENPYEAYGEVSYGHLLTPVIRAMQREKKYNAAVNEVTVDILNTAALKNHGIVRYYNVDGGRNSTTSPSQSAGQQNDVDDSSGTVSTEISMETGN